MDPKTLNMLLFPIMDFFSSLEAIVSAKRTCLCVGLDPRPDPSIKDLEERAAAALSDNKRIIEATAEYAAAFKPNLAFYEAMGSAGIAALQQTLSYIPRDIPVILDAKRCDIDSTAEAYAAALFETCKGDAVTLSPYMGRDAVDPFLAYKDKGVFVLCRTSNRGAGVFQDLKLRGEKNATGEALYIKVAHECTSWSSSIGLVVAGNDIAALRAVREAAPKAWFLAPGIGVQGGSADTAFAAGARDDGLGILVVAVRSIAQASDPKAEARKLRDAMEEARKGIAGARRQYTGATFVKEDDLKGRFLKALIDTECFRLGDFTLKSGKKSPFYIDLRRLISSPEALSLAAEAYAHVAEGVEYERIAGIPAAGLPLATAASLCIGKPMIWPRMPVKEHGTGNRVEGEYVKGERVLLLDDLITTGASKLEAADILRGENLIVEDLVVLIERGRQGRRDMDAAGIRLHAFAHVRELFAVCESIGLIDARRRSELEAYVDEE
jgi:uridine monophosphate synthetase